MLEEKIQAKEDRICSLQAQVREYTEAWRQALHSTAVLDEQLEKLRDALEELWALRRQSLGDCRLWQGRREEAEEALDAARQACACMQRRLDRRDARARRCLEREDAANRREG